MVNKSVSVKIQFFRNNFFSKFYLNEQFLISLIKITGEIVFIAITFNLI